MIDEALAEGFDPTSELEAAGAISNVTYLEGIEIYGYDIWCGGQDVSVPKKIEGTEVIGIGNGAFCDGCGGGHRTLSFSFSS